MPVVYYVCYWKVILLCPKKRLFGQIIFLITVLLPVLAAANPIKTPAHIANLLFLFNFIKSWVQEHVDIYCIYT